MHAMIWFWFNQDVQSVLHVCEPTNKQIKLKKDQFTLS